MKNICTYLAYYYIIKEKISKVYIVGSGPNHYSDIEQEKSHHANQNMIFEV